jgi:hypothetical protein
VLPYILDLFDLSTNSDLKVQGGLFLTSFHR